MATPHADRWLTLFIPTKTTEPHGQIVTPRTQYKYKCNKTRDALRKTLSTLLLCYAYLDLIRYSHSTYIAVYLVLLRFKFSPKCEYNSVWVTASLSGFIIHSITNFVPDSLIHSFIHSFVRSFAYSLLLSLIYLYRVREKNVTHL